MGENLNQEELQNQVDEKINLGKELIKRLSDIENIDGVPKLQRKIRQEIQFLNKLKTSKYVKKEQLSCSNLRHLGALVECALRHGVQAVCKTFNTNDGTKFCIDVVSEGGRVWTKVIARNPRSLSALSHGNASYGARSILDQASDYMECAKIHPCMYQIPQIVFEFVSGIEDHLASKLQNIGVVVTGELIQTEGNVYESTDEESWETESDESDINLTSDQYRQYDPSIDNRIEVTDTKSELTTLNLDVTTMMAYISNLTNGGCNFVFKQPILTQQAAWEAKNPVKPILDKLFEGKELVCSETAWDDFDKILSIVGGETEKSRTEELRKRLRILPDDTGGEDDERRATLKVRGRVRLRSKMIFNFGHRIKALTVSANEGFVRAANQQGLGYAAFVHEPRALTEQKEATATPIQQ